MYLKNLPWQQRSKHANEKSSGGKTLKRKASDQKKEAKNKETTYRVEATPVAQTCLDDGCKQFEITLDEDYIGIIQRMKNGWKMEQLKDKR